MNYNEKNCLSFDQKKCLIVLGLAVKSKLPFILQGPTGVGKSHLIKLFARILGKKLHIIVLNKDNDISLLTKRNIFKNFDKNDEKDIEANINKIIGHIDDINKLSLKEKIKLLNESNLDEQKMKKFNELKEKYKFIHRFKYEKSEFLKAVEDGEWILLDNIENAPASIIERVTLLCGEKPELNLYENGQEPIHPKKGFQLFMTYNPERINHNESIPSILLDKCLIYYLDSFLNNQQAISQIIYGFLVNSNYSTNTDLLLEISSRLSNVQNKIQKELQKESEKNIDDEWEKISERTLTKFCKNWSFLKVNLNGIPSLIKNNFLYFYFPSSNIKKYNQIINNIINEKGVNFVPLAKNYIIECKEPLNLLNLLEQNINEKNENYLFNLGKFIFSCLDIPFEYLKIIQSKIEEVINKADKINYKNIYLPLKKFVKYLDETYISFEKSEKNINNIIIREAIYFPAVRILLLFEKLYKNCLLSWDCIDLLYLNTNLFESIKILSKQQNLEALAKFFEEVIRNINNINDIIRLFPYSLFKKTKFSLLNEIFGNIFKNTAKGKINFKIKMKSKEYIFKYTQNENNNCIIIVDLNLNDNNELIITNQTIIIIPTVNKDKSIPALQIEANEYSKLNMYYLMFIEKISSCKIIDKKSFKKIYKEIILKLDDSINLNTKVNFSLSDLFKNKNNLVSKIWSILFIKNADLMEDLSYLLKNIERNLLIIFNYLIREILNESIDTFKNKLDIIMSMSKDLSIILDEKTFIVNLSKDENYIDNLNFKSIEERKKGQHDLKNEINNINFFITKYKDFSFVKEIFFSYSKLLEDENLRMIKKTDELEIVDFKERIANKIKIGFTSNKLIKSLLKDLKNRNNFDSLKEFESLIDNYLAKYTNNLKEEKKIKIFSEIDISEETIKEDKLNKNVNLLELLLKYSEIKDIVNNIITNNQNKLVYLQKLNEIVSPKYLDFFNSFLILDSIKIKNIIEDIYGFLDAMLVQEVINNNLGKNLLEIKKLLNNLYNINNYGKIDEIWCKNIEKKYNLSSNIYMPILNDKSFINLFIKIKNNTMEKEEGFLIEIDSSYNDYDLSVLNDIFNDINKIFGGLIHGENQQLILDIGNTLIYHLINNKQKFVQFNDINKLCDVIQNFMNKNKNDSSYKIKIHILQNYLIAKELYLNYNNNEKLLLDDVNTQQDRKELFTKKYHSLINYLNYNQNIFKALIEEPDIFNFKYSLNSIPLWLICIRTFANSKNIRPFFEYSYDIINYFEEEFKNKIMEKLRRQYKDIYWVLLITPNYTKIIVNEFYERTFKFFNILLYDITLLSQDNQYNFYEIIKNFIFNLFAIAYDKGINYFMTEKIELFTLNNNLSIQLEEYTNTKFEMFYNSKSMTTLKSLFEIILKSKNKDSLKSLMKNLRTDLKEFEKQYNIDYKNHLIKADFSNMVRTCEKYNNLIDTYKYTERTKEEINILLNLKNHEIQNFINNKDINFVGENFVFFDDEPVQKVEYIQENKYMIKYAKNDTVEEFQYFKDTNFDVIYKEYKSLIEKMKEAYNLINSLNKSNINKVRELNNLMGLIEEKRELLHINDKLDKFIIERINNNFNINIEDQIKNILLQINKIHGYIKSILNDLDSYENDKDINYIEYMKNETNLYIPDKDIFKSIQNNNDEYFNIKKEKEIIPYYIIQNNRIIGCDEIKYDLGTLNLNDPVYQNIYFASFDDNIKFKIIKKEDDVDIIQRNKIYLIKVKIREKREEEIEDLQTRGSFKFEFNGSSKIVEYCIKYQLEAVKIYLNCDKYKLKYIGKSTFLLNSPILFQDETINFTIKNLFSNSENNFKINLTTFEDNTCIKPLKIINKEGFALQIKSDSANEIISCLVTIFICQRFQFQIKLNCQVKPLDFDLLIASKNQKGFLNKKIYCPFEIQDEFDFILYIGISHNRVCKAILENDYDENLILITNINGINKIIFFNSIKINIHIKLLKKEETSMKLKVKIKEKTKEITIIFTSENKCKNTGYKLLENELKKEDDSDFFTFTFNEITAHGMKRKDKPEFDNNIIRKKPGFINSNKFLKTPLPNLKEIDTNIDINNINIGEIIKFYNRISEAARILPIYCLNYKNEKSSSNVQKIARKNFYILEEIYNSLIRNDEKDAKDYEENYFYEEIKEFIDSFNYMKSIIEIKDESIEKLIEKIKKYIKQNKIISGPLKWIAEKFMNLTDTKKIKDLIKKYNINLEDFQDTELDDDNPHDNPKKISPKKEEEKTTNNKQLKRSNTIDKNNINNNINNMNAINNLDKNRNNIFNNNPNYNTFKDNITTNDTSQNNSNIIKESQNFSEIKNDTIPNTKKNPNKPVSQRKPHKTTRTFVPNKEKIIQNVDKPENDKKDKNDDKVNSLLNSLKDEEERKKEINERIKSVRQEKAYIKQDIWKKNGKKDSVFTDREIIPEDKNFDNYLNNQSQFSSKFYIKQAKITSLETVKKQKTNNKNSLKPNFKKIKPIHSSNEDKNEGQNPFQPNFMITNIDKMDYLPDKDLLIDKKHDFESGLQFDDSVDKDNDNNIVQMVRNKQVKIFFSSDKTAKFIEKNFEEKKNYQIKFEISFEDNEEYFNEFDKDLIDKIISNIQEKENEDEDETYSVTTQEPTIPQNIKTKNDIMKNDEEYILKDLLTFSKKYMEKILGLLSKTDINFQKISFCFIIDCSLYLGIEVKLLNLMVIISIIKLFYIVDIEFSIFLAADDNYKIIIKQYDDYINYEELIEILYETLIIKRYRNNILKTMKTAVEYLKNKKRNTIYIASFDSMDESFTYPNYWMKNIFNDETNSFILIPEISRLYLEKNEEIINNMMKNFLEKIQKNAVSKVKIIDHNLFASDIDLGINYLFSEIFNFLNDINVENLNKNNNKNNNEMEEQLQMKKFEYFEEIIKSDFYKNFDKIYFINNKRERNKNNLKEASYKLENNEFPNYKEKNFPSNNFFQILLKNSFQDRTLIESIFYPNKATQKMLSTKGTEIDILALILYTLRPVQEPMIYLENKGGLVRDYSITVIIDNSKSCFSEFNEKHSFLTIINLFQIINSMAIPSFDIIVTSSEGNKPNIVLFDKPSILVFKNYSIFERLLTLLSNPVLNTDLSKAINLAYELKKKKKNNRDSYLFILTDGLSHKHNEQKIFYYSDLCQNSGIKIFGIGLGIYPYMAQRLFNTLIYSVNPEHLLKALSKIFGKIIKTETELELISNKQQNGDLREIFNKIEKNDKFYYGDLRKELQDIEKGDDIFNIFSNVEKNTYDEMIFVEKGENLEIYSQNILRTQKILIVMLWSFDLNKKNESPYVSPRYIVNPSSVNGNVCINTALEHFGIETEIVLDYESAINELLKTNDKGECNYYAVWIFCGPQYAILPPINGEKNKSNPNLVEEFINVLIEFWNNGGALVFMADGDPLNFQVNLFLEKIDFSKNEKPDFRIHGDYIGNKYLIQDKNGKMDKVGIFNKSNHKIIYKGKEIQRQSLSHNLGQIYEGYTISYAVDKNNKKIHFSESEKLLPFKPFAINSEGGLSTLLYETDSLGRGDILIDCGYTKCFLNMYKTGTYKFIQNIAGWTARPEIKFLAENINPWDWRPKGIKYKVDYNAVYNGFLKLENEESDLANMKTLFCIDDSGSTDENEFYYSELKDIISYYYNKNRGDIIYLWNETKKKITEEELEEKIETMEANGDTYPYLIADIIEEEKNNKCRHLVIITDGNVSQEEINEADEKIKNINYNFDYVTVYILGDEADLSVGAPFCRNTPNKTFEKKGPEDNFKELVTLSKEDIETLEHLEQYYNYNEFMNNYDKIFKAVQAKCIGTSDENLKNRLEIMFANIMKDSKNIDFDLINKSKKALIGMTEGSIKNNFTLDQINAATWNLYNNLF